MGCFCLFGCLHYGDTFDRLLPLLVVGLRGFCYALGGVGLGLGLCVVWVCCWVGFGFMRSGLCLWVCGWV